MQQTVSMLAAPIGVVAGLITAFGVAWLNHYFQLRREALKDDATSKKDATYLAVHLAVILERFAYECASAITDADFSKQISDYAGSVHCAEIPELGEFPKGMEWKSLDAQLSARALQMQTERLLSVRSIQSMCEIDISQSEDHSWRECGKTGYRAWKIAEDLRAKYDLAPFRHLGWDFVKELAKYHHMATKHRPDVA